MTNDIKIPRELLEVIANSSERSFSEINAAIQQARQLLAAPVVESQPIAMLSKCLKGPKAGEFIVVTELGATGNDIWSADIPVYIEPPDPVVESQEPVAWALLNGNGQIRDLTDRWDVAKHWDGLVESLYTSPPVPVAVVLPERLTAAELEELEVIEVLLHGQGLSNLAGTVAADRQFIDEIVCLDAPAQTLRLPERKPIEALAFNWTTADVENTGWNACLDKVKELNQ